MAIELMKHQIKNHHSSDGARLEKLLTLLQQMQSQSESTQTNDDTNFNIEITVDYKRWPKTIGYVSHPTGNIPVVSITAPRHEIKQEIDEPEIDKPEIDGNISVPPDDSHETNDNVPINEQTLTEASTSFSCYNYNFKDKYSYIAQQNRYYCDLCLDAFETVTEIENHLHSTCQSTKAIRHLCTVCNVEFKSVNIQRHHMHVFHPDSTVAQTIRDKKAICDYCGRTYKHLNDLRRHMFVHNNLPRPYVCNVCNRGFVQMASYHDHLRTHTGDKPFKCTAPNCDRTFTSRPALHMHRLNRHTDKEKYQHQCEYCQKRFSVKHRLMFVWFSNRIGRYLYLFSSIFFLLLFVQGS